MRDMDNISAMESQTRIYLDVDTAGASPHIHVPAMGIHEVMPIGTLRHGGQGSAYPILFMFFHDPAVVYDEQGTPVPAHQKMIVWGYEALHHYGHPDHRWDHSWLQVRGEWAVRAFAAGDVPLNRLLDLPDDAVFLRYLHLLYDELNARPGQDPDMVEGILRLLWHDLARNLGTARVPQRDPRLEASRRYIEAHYNRPFDLDRAAEEACLSRSHFCARFAREYGVPPKEYALRLRLHRAAHLLGNRDLAVFQIARIVGYDDALYFSRLFRKRYNTSPQHYRDRLANPRASR